MRCIGTTTETGAKAKAVYRKICDIAIKKPDNKNQREPERVIESFDEKLPLVAYEFVMKASHTFNLLDARRAISVTERQRFILRVRTLAMGVAHRSTAAVGGVVGLCLTLTSQSLRHVRAARCRS